MLFRTESLAPAMLQLERLPMDEASTSHIELLPLVESERLGKKVLSLESALQYCHDSYTDLDNTISRLANRYGINEQDIILSIAPASVYLNEEVNGLVRSFLQEGVPFVLSCNMGSYEGRLITEACAEAERTGSTDYLEALSEGIMDSLRAVRNGAMTGAGKGAVGVAGDAVRGGFGAIGQGLKSGFTRGAEDFVDKRVFGRFLDTDKQVWVQDPGNPNGGRWETVQGGNENGMIKSFIRNHVTDNEEVINMADSMAKSLRGQITGDVVTKVKQVLGVAGQTLNPQNLVNALSQRINYFGRRIADGKGDPRHRSLFQQIIDKLKDLKDRLIAKIRGHA